MSEVSNADIYNVLINLRGDLSRLEGKVDGHAEKLTEHISDDKVMAEAIQKLQLSAARQRGFVAAISSVGAIVGAGIGAAIDYFSNGGHH